MTKKSPQDATEHDVQELAKNFIYTVAEDFGNDDLAYAKDEARGDFRGFAALHDRMDANVVLDEALHVYGIEDGWDEPSSSEDSPRVLLMNRVMDEINHLLLETIV